MKHDIFSWYALLEILHIANRTWWSMTFIWWPPITKRISQTRREVVSTYRCNRTTPQVTCNYIFNHRRWEERPKFCSFSRISMVSHTWILGVRFRKKTEFPLIRGNMWPIRSPPLHRACCCLIWWQKTFVPTEIQSHWSEPFPQWRGKGI